MSQVMCCNYFNRLSSLIGSENQDNPGKFKKSLGYLCGRKTSVIQPARFKKYTLNNRTFQRVKKDRLFVH